MPGGPGCGHGPGKEPPGCAITAGGQQNVDDLAELVDGPVQVAPTATDLDVGLVQEPTIAGGVAGGLGGVGEERRERRTQRWTVTWSTLHTPFGQHLFDVANGQAEELLQGDMNRRLVQSLAIGGPPDATDPAGALMPSIKGSVKRFQRAASELTSDMVSSLAAGHRDQLMQALAGDAWLGSSQGVPS